MMYFFIYLILNYVCLIEYIYGCYLFKDNPTKRLLVQIIFLLNYNIEDSYEPLCILFINITDNQSITLQSMNKESISAD